MSNPKIIFDHPNRFRISLTGQDLTGKHFLARFLPQGAGGDLTKGIALESENDGGIDDTDAANGTFDLLLTQEQSKKFPIGAKVNVSVSVLNADETVFAHGTTQYVVVA